MMRLAVVVVNCPHCGHSARLGGRAPEIVPGQDHDGEGRHRRDNQSWAGLATQVLRRRSMTLRLTLLLVVVALPASAVTAAIALIRNFGSI